jgi:hypothetical protein
MESKRTLSTLHTASTTAKDSQLWDTHSEGKVREAGHKDKMFANQILIIVSEFVHLKTGSYRDEDLAELYQGIVKPSLKHTKDVMSGDAIRKKRKYLKKKCPELYAQAVNKAEHYGNKPVSLCPLTD